MATRKQTKSEAIEELQKKIAQATGVQDIKIHVRGVTPEAVKHEPCTDPECRVSASHGPCVVVSFTPVPKRARIT
jgi:hypothetical protein